MCSQRLSFACSLRCFRTTKPCSGACEDLLGFGEPKLTFWLGPARMALALPHFGQFVPKWAVLCSQEGMVCQARSLLATNVSGRDDLSHPWTQLWIQALTKSEVPVDFPAPQQCLSEHLNSRKCSKTPRKSLEFWKFCVSSSLEIQFLCMALPSHLPGPIKPKLQHLGTRKPWNIGKFGAGFAGGRGEIQVE